LNSGGEPDVISWWPNVAGRYRAGPWLLTDSLEGVFTRPRPQADMGRVEIRGAQVSAYTV